MGKFKELLEFRSLALALLALICACAGPQSVAELPAFEDGAVHPEALIAVAEDTARIQTFVADSERVVDLQLMVARGVDVGDEPLLVEVRNLSLDRRYGHGEISAFEARPFVPTWRSVEWKERPVVEAGESYALVFMTDAYNPDWLHAVAQDTYSGGAFSYSHEHGDLDVGFRIQYAEAVTQSKFANVEEPLRTYHFERLLRFGKSWGERYYRPLDGRTSKRLLPECDGNRCVNPNAVASDPPEERAKRAAAATRSCGDAPVESLYFERGVLGVSCGDVCKGHGFAECVGTYPFVDVCDRDTYKDTAIATTCDSLVSSAQYRDRKACLCSHEPLPHEISDDPEVVEKRVHKNFALDDRDRPVLKPGRVATGLTCAQTCEVLGPESCDGQTFCSREITPEFSRCPPCKDLVTLSEADKFRRASVRVGDRLVTTYGGQVSVVDPDKGRVRNYPLESDLDLADRAVDAVGRFAVWSNVQKTRYRYSEGEKAHFIALDTRNGKFHRVSIDVEVGSLVCKPGAHSRSLEGRGSVAVFCFGKSETFIHTLTGKRLEAPPSNHRHIRSWDGKTAVLASTERSDSQQSWSAGEFKWSLAKSPDHIRSAHLSSHSIPKMKTIFANTSDHPNIIDGYYYGYNYGKVWRFDPESETFEGLELRSDEGITISEDLIRVGHFVLDRKSDVFKQVPATILHDVGSYGFIEASQCPDDLSCQTLAEPLGDFAVVDLNVEDYETPRTRKMSAIDPDDPKGRPKFYDSNGEQR